MKSTLFIILTLIVHLSFGQTEKPANKVVAENFVKNYNSDDYEAIFSMFADEMKEALPLEKTNAFLQGLKSQAGSITNREFVNYENGTYASYQTTFERAVYSLNISIDEHSKINGLFVKPLVEDVNSENVINNLTAENSLITKEQAEIIFEKAKNFPNNTQLSMAIITNGKVSYVGTLKKNDTISKTDNQKSVFEIGSISKVFTATLLANFVLNKKINQNDTINAYVNTAFHKDIKLSFVDLANHTSGLPGLPSNLDLSKVNVANPYKEYTEKELEQYLAKYMELANIGEYQYSNLGAGLLGYSLGKMENKSYATLLQKMIFEKYQMQNSTADMNTVKGSLINGLNSEGKEVPNWEFSVLAGAGAIFSTVEDLTKFAIAQFDPTNKELHLTREKTFEINENMDIGLGWHILKSKSENLWYWHNGGTGGYTSSMVIEENAKNGIVILSNVSAFNPEMANIDKLCFELMKTVEKK